MSNIPDSETSRPRARRSHTRLASLVEHLGEARTAFAENIRNPNLRRAQVSFAAVWTGEWAFTTGAAVYAFQHGGATAVGVLGLARMLPAALLSPVGTALADRHRRERVLAAATCARGIGSAATAALVHFGAPAGTVYVMAVLATIPFTVYRPAHSALLPLLCQTPRELSSANVTRGVLDGAGALFGPLLAAALLNAGGVGGVFAAAAALSLYSAVPMMQLRYERVAVKAAAMRPRIVRDVLDGFRALANHPDIRLLVGLTLLQAFLRGALNVFVVVVTFDLLHAGAADVGVLTAAVGAGGLGGAVAASLLVGSSRLGEWFGAGVFLWGLPIALLGVRASTGVAVALLAIVGIGNALVDVGLFTLLARIAPEQLLARVFGALETLIAAAVGLGSVITPFAVSVLGIRASLAVIGGFVPVVIVLCWRRLRTLDATIGVRDVEIALLRRVPMLRPLPVPTIEYLALQVTETQTAAGATVFAQGDAGDRFYVIADGEADVIGDGQLIRTIGPGDFFGEIALLQDVPRTTTVRARTELRLHSIERDSFLPAVSGYSGSAAEAEAEVASRLASFRPARQAI